VKRPTTWPQLARECLKLTWRVLRKGLLLNVFLLALWFADLTSIFDGTTIHLWQLAGLAFLLAAVAFRVARNYGIIEGISHAFEHHGAGDLQVMFLIDGRPIGDWQTVPDTATMAQLGFEPQFEGKVVGPRTTVLISRGGTFQQNVDEIAQDIEQEVLRRLKEEKPE
jgi:hypothetical protein